jgi:hypothetical protein
MNEQPRVVRLQLANGNTLNAFELPNSTAVETTGDVLGVDYWGGRVGDGVTVLLVGTDELAAASSPVRPDEEPTP